MTYDNDQAARNWAMWCHLSSLVWLLPLLLGFLFIAIPLSIPFLNILGPLFVWLAKKNQYPLIDDHGKESLNFQISMTLYSIGAVVVFLLLLGVTCGISVTSSSSANDLIWAIAGVLGIVCSFFALIVGILQLVLVIFAAVKAKKGEFYHYPYTMRFLR
ncbi:MAG TPA: DUF4870 domain-containing protein [Cyanophyceae cyanobacterium]